MCTKPVATIGVTDPMGGRADSPRFHLASSTASPAATVLPSDLRPTV